MRVSRLGLTPLKGTRHLDRAEVELVESGPVGDRVLCLVDPARKRVVRTVEHPGLLATTAVLDGDRLTCTLAGAERTGRVVGTGTQVTADYWGRPASLEVVDGPWAAAYSALLGTEVVLARVARPGEVVYGGSVSLVTTSSLARLARDVGPLSQVGFRATMTVDTGGAPPFVEQGWAGQTLRVGEAEVRVVGGLPRCAVVGLDPQTGGPGPDVLGALAGYRRGPGDLVFGVDAVVTRPGRVGLAAPVERG